MSITRYHQHEIVIKYLFMKINSRMPNLHFCDLKDFLDNKGWRIYDINQMIKDIELWQEERKEILV